MCTYRRHCLASLPELGISTRPDGRTLNAHTQERVDREYNRERHKLTGFPSSLCSAATERPSRRAPVNPSPPCPPFCFSQPRLPWFQQQEFTDLRILTKAESRQVCHYLHSWHSLACGNCIPRIPGVTQNPYQLGEDPTVRWQRRRRRGGSESERSRGDRRDGESLPARPAPRPTAAALLAVESADHGPRGRGRRELQCLPRALPAPTSRDVNAPTQEEVQKPRRGFPDGGERSLHQEGPP